jgi:nitrite reductase (NADH) small subunit
MTEWIIIGPLDEIPRQGARTIETPRGAIAVFRTYDDEVFALRDRCPHKGGPLSEGMIHGKRVTCPLHAWVFELESGQAVPPDVGCAKPFPVRIQDGQIELGIAEELVATWKLHAQQRTSEDRHGGQQKLA